MMTKSIYQLALILITFSVYSGSTIFSKMASMQKTLSIAYFLCLGGVVLTLGVYAILWQKVLSFMTLNKAFLCKSVTILMILAVSVLIFNEVVTINNIIGAGFIMSGLTVLVWKE